LDDDVLAEGEVGRGGRAELGDGAAEFVAEGYGDGGMG
jgi:hypothetical protein